MTAEQIHRLFLCQCTQCLERPDTATAQLHSHILEMAALLNEKHRRQFAALMALQFGHGGITQVAEITGLSRNTIARGKRDLTVADFDSPVRAAGAGRKLFEKKSRCLCPRSKS